MHQILHHRSDGSQHMHEEKDPTLLTLAPHHRNAVDSTLRAARHHDRHRTVMVGDAAVPIATLAPPREDVTTLARAHALVRRHARVEQMVAAGQCPTPAHPHPVVAAPPHTLAPRGEPTAKHSHHPVSAPAAIAEAATAATHRARARVRRRGSPHLWVKASSGGHLGPSADATRAALRLRVRVRVRVHRQERRSRQRRRLRRRRIRRKI